jgi:tetratricopeptide (TPR) repeat protein
LLLDLAFEWINSDKDELAGQFLSKALDIIHGKHGVPSLQPGNEYEAYAMRILGHRSYERGDKKAALQYYLKSLQIHSDITGSIRGQIEDSLRAARCFADLGDLDQAQRLYAESEHLAESLGDSNLVERVRIDSSAAFQQFHALTKTFILHKELAEEAKLYLDTQEYVEYEKMNQLLFDRISALQYTEAKKVLFKMKNIFPCAKKYFLFAEANLYHRQNNWQQEVKLLSEWKRLFGAHILVEANLGIAYRLLKDYKSAEKALLLARELYQQRFDSDYPLALSNLIYVKHEEGLKNEAEVLYEVLKNMEEVPRSMKERVEAFINR